MELPDTTTAVSIRLLFEAFLKQEDLIARLPSRLAIVEFGRVRMRE